MKKAFIRLVSLLLLLTLIPLSSFAEGRLDEPLYRSDFTARVWLNADAFPNDGLYHYADWQNLLSKLSIHGIMDFQRPMEFKDKYIRIDGNLRLNEADTLPFHYESYGVSRYLTTDALDGDYLYFNMLNFFQFMLKPYYFMELPTNLIAVLAAPDLTLWTINEFLSLWKDAIGTETRIRYKDFKRKVNTINRKISKDQFLIYYFLITNSLGLIYGNNLIYDDICNLPAIYQNLDPNHKGFFIKNRANATLYKIADTVVLTTTDDGWHFHLPDTNGYVFDIELTQNNGELLFTIDAVLNEESRFHLRVQVDGLALNDALIREGDIKINVSGNAIAENFSRAEYETKLHYRHKISSEVFPRNESFELSWYHPSSDLPAIGISYETATEIVPSENIRNENYTHPYIEDFFGMNSDILAQMKSKYMKPLIVALLPFATQIPIGVYSDAYAMLKESGFLAMLGLEGM